MPSISITILQNSYIYIASIIERLFRVHLQIIGFADARSMHVSQQNAVSMHHRNSRWAWALKCDYYSFIKERCFSCDFTHSTHDPYYLRFFTREPNNIYFIACTTSHSFSLSLSLSLTQVINRHFYYLSCLMYDSK